MILTIICAASILLGELLSLHDSYSGALRYVYSPPSMDTKEKPYEGLALVFTTETRCILQLVHSDYLGYGGIHLKAHVPSALCAQIVQ